MYTKFIYTFYKSSVIILDIIWKISKVTLRAGFKITKTTLKCACQTIVGFENYYISKILLNPIKKKSSNDKFKPENSIFSFFL